MAMALSRTGRTEAGISLADEVGELSISARYTARGLIAFDTGNLAESVEWMLKLYDINPGDTFANNYLATEFGRLDLMPEALRMRDDLWFQAYRAAGQWPQAVLELEKLLETNPGDSRRRIYLASALLFAGRYAEARSQFEALLADEPDAALRDPIWYAPFPTLRAAWLRQQDGDEQGARALLALARTDLEAHEAAGRQVSWNERSAALLAAMEGNDAAALHHLERAYALGHRDLSLFDEPALSRLEAEPVVQDLRRRMIEDLAEQRRAVLQLICRGNPAVDQWRPLPGTCAEAG